MSSTIIGMDAKHLLDTNMSETVDVSQLLSEEGVRNLIKKNFVDNKSTLKAFFKNGKKVKDRLMNKVGGIDFANVSGVRIRLNGHAKITDITFGRLNASIMIIYYEDVILRGKLGDDEMITPSLGAFVPKIEGNELYNRMLCLAGRGAHFIPKYLYLKDDSKTDPRVGIMMAICVCIDWSNFCRNNPDEACSASQFMSNPAVDKYKDTFLNCVINMGHFLDVLSAKQVEGFTSSMSHYNAIETLERMRSRFKSKSVNIAAETIIGMDAKHLLVGINRNIRETVDVRKLLSEKGVRDLIKKKFVDQESRLKEFLVRGKNLKDRLRNAAERAAYIHFNGLKIRMQGDAKITDITFARLNASIMIIYYEDVVLRGKLGDDKMITPSLGALVPKIEGNELYNRMLCLAGPGAHFIPKYLYLKDDSKTDPRVGIMMALCLCIDWSNFCRNNPDKTSSAVEFMSNPAVDQYKTTFLNCLRNMGHLLDKMSAEQVEGFTSSMSNYDANATLQRMKSRNLAMLRFIHNLTN